MKKENTTTKPDFNKKTKAELLIVIDEMMATNKAKGNKIEELKAKLGHIQIHLGDHLPKFTQAGEVGKELQKSFKCYGRMDKQPATKHEATLANNLVFKVLPQKQKEIFIANSGMDCIDGDADVRKQQAQLTFEKF